MSSLDKIPWNTHKNIISINVLVTKPIVGFSSWKWYRVNIWSYLIINMTDEIMRAAVTIKLLLNWILKQAFKYVSWSLYHSIILLSIKVLQVSIFSPDSKWRQRCHWQLVSKVVGGSNATYGPYQHFDSQACQSKSEWCSYELSLTMIAISTRSES